MKLLLALPSSWLKNEHGLFHRLAQQTIGSKIIHSFPCTMEQISGNGS